jgi:mannose-1-phosphate guanylyltransferase/phosphomannomutase
MAPLSENSTKAMLPFLGAPLLEYLVLSLRKYGLTDFISTSRGRRGEIEEFFGDGSRHMVNIRYASGKWRGTAGSVADLVANMRDELTHPLIVVYGDSLIRADFARLLQFHREKRALATMLCHAPDFSAFRYEYHDADPSFPDRGPRTNYGVADLNTCGLMNRFEEKPLLSEIPVKFTRPVANATAYVIERDAWNSVANEGTVDFTKDFFPKLVRDNASTFGFTIDDGYRLDVGTLRQYYGFQMAVLESRLRLPNGNHWNPLENRIGENVERAESAVLQAPCIISDSCSIADGAEIECSVLGKGVVVERGARITRSIIHDDVVIGPGASIHSAVVAAGVRISGDAEIPADTVLGPGCKIGGEALSIDDEQLCGLAR